MWLVRCFLECLVQREAGIGFGEEEVSLCTSLSVAMKRDENTLNG